MAPKKQALIGLFMATFVALPLFVFSVINVNLNFSEKADEGSMISVPKGGNENYDYLIDQTPQPIVESSPISFNDILPKATSLENQFFTKYAMYLYAGFLVFVIVTIIFAINARKMTSNRPINLE